MRNKYLIAILLLVSLVALLSGCGPATPTASAGGLGGGGGTQVYASQPNGSAGTGLTVVGTGQVETDPDIAYLTLGVDLKRNDAAAAVGEASGQMERVLAAIKGGGVAEEDIHTAGYNLWVEQRYNPQTGEPTGEIDFHVIHTVRITVRDLGRIGTLLSAAVEAGANTVNEVSFSVADPEKLISEARQKAIADAQKRAQEMAGALGLTLGKVLSVSESGGWVPGPYYVERGMGGGGYAAAEVPLPAGSFSVSVSVVIVYELP